MKRHIIRLVIILSLCSLSASRSQAQTVAFRTNALLWGAEAANLSADLTLADHSTIGITGVWSVADSWIHDTNLRGWQLEYRYWFSHQPFHSLFVGPIAGIFHYRIDQDPESQMACPVGVNCGYAFTLSNHWNLEACYGVGCLFYNCAQYDDELQFVAKSQQHKFTTINLGLNLSYVF